MGPAAGSAKKSSYRIPDLDGIVPLEKLLRSCLLVVAILSESQSCSGRIDNPPFAVTPGNVVPFRWSIVPCKIELPLQ
jgi:hypothetical protein